MGLAIALAFGLILAGYKPVAKGLVFGTLFSVVNFVLIARTIPLKVGPSRNRARFMTWTSIALRYGLMAAALLVALRLETLNLVATAVGLFMIPVVILFDHLPGLGSFTRPREF